MILQCDLSSSFFYLFSFLDSMSLFLSRIFIRTMSTLPTSHFITLKDRPIVEENGEIRLGPLRLHYWQWEGNEPTVLFCHAASFHSRCYDRIINEGLKGHRVIALDFRCHGRSQTHPAPYRFPWFGDDLLQFIEQMNLSSENLFGIGHSFGGYALVRAAAQADRRLFRSLLLLDPVIFPEGFYGSLDDSDQPTDNVARRKSQWTSIDEMIERLEKRPPFSRWPKDVLRNYSTYALDEHFRLRCLPEGEASIYRSGVHATANIFPLIEQSKFIQNIPIHIVRSAISVTVGTLEASPTDPDLFRRFQKSRDVQLESGDHLFPMEHPNLVIRFLNDLFNENENLRSNL